jgi:hypothetical protein
MLSIDKIINRCPWYKRLHLLMGTSPVVERSAIANSMSDLNVSSITRGQAADQECDLFVESDINVRTLSKLIVNLA